MMSSIVNILMCLGGLFFVTLVLMFIYTKSAKTVNEHREDHGSGEKYSKNAPSN